MAQSNFVTVLHWDNGTCLGVGRVLSRADRSIRVEMADGKIRDVLPEYTEAYSAHLRFMKQIGREPIPLPDNWRTEK